MDCIAIGVGSAAFPLVGRQPGWDAHSVGYHSDDGRLFDGSGVASRPYGPCFGPGDVVGCGLCTTSREIFFTHNGVYLGVACTASAQQRPLHPVVGLDARAAVVLNLGQRPFAFDLRTLPAHMKAETADDARADGGTHHSNHDGTHASRRHASGRHADLGNAAVATTGTAADATGTDAATTSTAAATGGAAEGAAEGAAAANDGAAHRTSARAPTPERAATVTRLADAGGLAARLLGMRFLSPHA